MAEKGFVDLMSLCPSYGDKTQMNRMSTKIKRVKTHPYVSEAANDAMRNKARELGISNSVLLSYLLENIDIILDLLMEKDPSIDAVRKDYRAPKEVRKKIARMEKRAKARTKKAKRIVDDYKKRKPKSRGI